MKKIEAVIHPAKVSDVCAALEEVGCPGIMFSEIGDRRKQKGVEQEFRRKRYYHTPLLTKAKLEIVVDDEDVNRMVKAIRGAAKSGEAGDDKIFVLDLVEYVRISAEERRNEAIG